MKMKLTKANKLEPGDKVACISLSWGGAYVFPNRYIEGKTKLENYLGVQVVETPNALKSPSWLENNPKARLNDLLWAFKNPEIKAIFTIIGGDDSIRLLDYLKESDYSLIRNNPKIFVGFSDSTTVNFLCLKSGLISFYGPSVMFGVADDDSDFTLRNLKKLLFSDVSIGFLKNSSRGWSLDRIPWDKSVTKKRNKSFSIKCIQGSGSVKGILVGGCMEVLEMLKGTFLWPQKYFWKNKILFFETSELNPSIDQFLLWLRNYGATGILSQLEGIIFAIPGGDIAFDDPDYKKKIKKKLASFADYESALLKVAKEYGREDLVILTRVNFGHTTPMLTLPVGGLCELDANKNTISIVESVVESGFYE